MTGNARQVRLAVQAVLVLGFAGTPGEARQAGVEPGCRPDEIDMGDYCASLQPPSSEEESENRRVTPFRYRSMMPGHVGTQGVGSRQPQALLPPAAQQEPDIEPVTENSGPRPGKQPADEPFATAKAAPPLPEAAADPGHAANPAPAGQPASPPEPVTLGVQFGVFSSRARALGVAMPLAEAGLPVGLARMQSGDRVLWACIHGPFRDEGSAQAAARRLTIDHGVEDTYIKPLDGLELTELSHDTTEK